MWMLNRQTRYEIIRELVSSASPELIGKLVTSFGFDDESIDDIENRRKQLLEYLDEMQICWNDHNIDMTDKQYIKVVKRKR